MKVNVIAEVVGRVWVGRMEPRWRQKTRKEEGKKKISRTCVLCVYTIKINPELNKMRTKPNTVN